MAKEKVAAKAKAKAKAPAPKIDRAILGDIVSRASPANAGDVRVYIISAHHYETLKELAGEA